MIKILLPFTICFLFFSADVQSETLKRNQTIIQIENIENKIEKLNADVTDLKIENSAKPSPMFTLIVAIIGVTVASLSLIWNIATYFILQKSKFIIDYNFSASIIDDPISGPSEPIYSLSYKITNSSKTERYIYKPYILLPYEVESLGFLGNKINELTTVKFPIALKPGEVYKSEFALGKYMSNFINPTWFRRNCKIAVTDTLKKEFTSKKISLRDIKAYCLQNIENTK